MTDKKAKRKAISKKIRFEIFKRDSFACQYCGQSAPSVILHIDHIIPVCKGGENLITNLVTACQSCNLGKSGRKISDHSVIQKQTKQLKEINEKKEQLEMMQKWEQSLRNLDQSILTSFLKLLEANQIVFYNNQTEYLKDFIIDGLKLCGSKETFESLKIAFNKFGRDRNLIDENLKYFGNYFRGVLKNMHEEKLNPELAQEKKLARRIFKRLYEPYGHEFWKIDHIKKHIRECLELGHSLKDIELIYYQSNSTYKFEQSIKELING